MYKIISYIALVFALIQVSSNSLIGQSIPQPSIIDVSYHTAYIPLGYDSNDHIQIVAEGTFSNSCYRPAGYSLEIDHQSKEIRVFPKAYKYDQDGAMCAMVISQYSQVIDIGLLPSYEDYKVIQNSPYKPQLGKLNVKLAKTSSPDEDLYAPISQAYVEQNGKNVRLTITGEFKNTCSKLVAFKIDVDDNVIVGRPIIVMDQDVACDAQVTPFKYSEVVPVTEKGRYLVHIRSSNGVGINNLVDIY